jgi:hypothetical protein
LGEDFVLAQNSLAFYNKSMKKKFRLIQILIGPVLMIYAASIGHIPFELMFNAQTATGKIIELQYEVTDAESTYYPIVTFEVDGKAYKFKNLMGEQSNSGIGREVRVYYRAQEPEVAMMDMGAKNWLPWGPIFIMGLIAFLGAISQTSAKTTLPSAPPTIDLVHELARAGRKIDAIKVYRKVTRSGLKDAKDYVDNYLKMFTDI